MKNLLLILTAIFLMSIAACKKEKEETLKPNPKPQTMSAKINGILYNFDNVTTSFFSDHHIIKGSKNSGEYISLVVPDTSKVSTVFGSGIYSADGTDIDSSTEFHVVWMHQTNSEVGDFGFITADSIIITEGRYSVSW